MKEDINIDELLNGYMDGELTDRHRTEVQRLISHDDHIAGRLRQLQKCRTLVAALPPAEVSAGLLERIKTSLETRTVVGAEDTDFEDRRGAVHLFARRLTTAAALIVLVGILAAVVYNIVAVPEAAPQAYTFKGSLELGTSDVVAVENAINGASDISVSTIVDGGKKAYVLTGSRQAVAALLGDMNNVWDADSSKLIVETKAGVVTEVDRISAEGLIDIIRPLSNVRLTQDEGEDVTPPVSLKEQRKVSLTITVQESK